MLQDFLARFKIAAPGRIPGVAVEGAGEDLLLGQPFLFKGGEGVLDTVEDLAHRVTVVLVQRKPLGLQFVGFAPDEFEVIGVGLVLRRLVQAADVCRKSGSRTFAG
ncbi:MAG TPA: hypothetical protein DCS85_10250, partial [Verrucomicrobiales bacterium]|nr:hypothetical protein [Verrucomicrobiales bacterium]